MGKRLQLVGKKFGRLTVIEDVGNDKNGCSLWRCVCECGNETIVVGSQLTYGHTTSCGCRQKEAYKSIDNTTHGESHTKLYNAWAAMKQRCNNPSSQCWENYGGRGITYCSEWENYNVFREWAINNGYNDELTLDREDVNGNYDPNNCRWVPVSIQNNNKRTNRILEIDGVSHTVGEWAKISGINYETLLYRLSRGVHPKEAVFSPLKRKRSV